MPRDDKGTLPEELAETSSLHACEPGEPERTPLHELVTSLMGVAGAGYHQLTIIGTAGTTDPGHLHEPDCEMCRQQDQSESGMRRAIDKAATACWEAKDEIDHPAQPVLERPSTKIRRALYDLGLVLLDLSGHCLAEDVPAEYFKHVGECEEWFDTLAVLLPPDDFIIWSGPDYLWELGMELEHAAPNGFPNDDQGDPTTPEEGKVTPLRASVQKAMAVFDRAKQLWPDSCPEERVVQRQLHDLISSEGNEDDFPAYFEGTKWVGPSWETFRSYVNKGLRHLHGRKRFPRRGRASSRSAQEFKDL